MLLVLAKTAPVGRGRPMRCDEGGGRGLPPHRVVLGGARWCGQAQPSSFRMPWVDWLAWASIAVPAWVRTWVRVKLVISCAMSVSRIRDSDAVRFSAVTFRLAIVCSNRFWMAPRLARAVDTFWMAASMAVMAAVAPAAVLRSTVLTARSVELKPLVA